MYTYIKVCITFATIIQSHGVFLQLLILQAGAKVTTLHCLDDKYGIKFWLEKDGKNVWYIIIFHNCLDKNGCPLTSIFRHTNWRRRIQEKVWFWSRPNRTNVPALEQYHKGEHQLWFWSDACYWDVFSQLRAEGVAAQIGALWETRLRFWFWAKTGLVYNAEAWLGSKPGYQ